MASQVLAVLAAVGLIGAGVATAAETRAFDALPVLGAAGAADNARLCRVDVIRSGAPGSAIVNRSKVGETCICIVTTGPKETNGAAEDIVNSLLRDRTCDGAPPITAADAQNFAPGAILPVVFGVAGGTAGLAGAVSNDSAG